jgi:hypothetical protein
MLPLFWNSSFLFFIGIGNMSAVRAHSFRTFAFALATAIGICSATAQNRQKDCSSTTGLTLEKCRWLYDQGNFPDAQSPNKTKNSPQDNVAPLINQPTSPKSTNIGGSTTQNITTPRTGPTGNTLNNMSTRTGGGSPPKTQQTVRTPQSNQIIGNLPSGARVNRPRSDALGAGVAYGIGFGLGAIIGGAIIDSLSQPAPEAVAPRSRKKRLQHDD